MPDQFDDHSTDAMFATILTRMSFQDADLKSIKEDNSVIKTQVIKTNGRVTSLEAKWRWILFIGTGVAGIVHFIFEVWASFHK